MYSKTFPFYITILIITRLTICQAAAVSEKCILDEDCEDHEEKTECDDVLKICLCNRNHFIVRESTDGPVTCEPIRLEIGETCKVKEQCTHGIPGMLSDCVASSTGDEKICHCNEEISVYDPIEHDCHLIRNYIGDDCKVDAQCKIKLGELSFCYYMTECDCHIEAVSGRNGTTCLPIVEEIGGECEEAKQCTHGKPGNFSDCVDSENDYSKKVCKCVGGSKPGSHNHECMPPVDGNGEDCKTDGDCPGMHASCGGNGKCLCSGGYLHSKQKKDCLEIRNELGESCVESQQCQKGVPGMLSACVSGECKCTSFSVNEAGKHFCHRKAHLVGDPCQIDEQCWENLSLNSHCVGGKCECTKDSNPLDDFSKCV